MLINKDTKERYPSSPSVPAGKSNADRRYFPRWEACNRIVYRLEGDPRDRECFSKDIHCEGMCINAHELLDPQKMLFLTIYLSPTSDPIEAAGRPAWQRHDGNDVCVGIRFERLDSRARETIFNYAFEFKRDALVKNWFKGW